MKITTHDLVPAKDLHIAGNEPWLARLYADFPVPTGAPGGQPVLTGDLRVESEEGGSVIVKGRLSYAPLVACSRCDLPIAWPLDMKVEARFYPPGVNQAPREKNLSRAELDAYFITDGAIDLEELINDTVQTGLPTRILAPTADGDSCRICQADLTTEQVYRDPLAAEAEQEPASPLAAALKGLKLPN